MLVPFLVVDGADGGAAAVLSRTFIGRAIMAVSQDQLALRLMAADPVRIKRIAFGISIATAALAGAFLIIIQPVEPSVGRDYIGRVFAICVLGGLGSFPGTLMAAMLLGVVESLTATFYGPSWAPAVAFGFLLITLAVRPVRPCMGGVRRMQATCGRSPSGSLAVAGRRRAGLRPVARWSATSTTSSPATSCCNSSCWRPPGTSSAAIPAM